MLASCAALRTVCTWTLTGGTGSRITSGSLLSEHSHPVISPANASMQKAVQANPLPSSGTYVKSATCNWPGWLAVKLRFTRSGAR